MIHVALVFFAGVSVSVSVFTIQYNNTLILKKEIQLVTAQALPGIVVLILCTVHVSCVLYWPKQESAYGKIGSLSLATTVTTVAQPNHINPWPPLTLH